MFEYRRIKDLDDFFLNQDKREKKGVYVYRINGYNDRVDSFIKKYFKYAQKCGNVIAGGLKNPDKESLAYYSKVMGSRLEFTPEFISAAVSRWMPVLNFYQHDTLSELLYRCMVSMKKSGKSDEVLRGVFVKLMCLINFSFENTVCSLGENKVPKILYEGRIDRCGLVLLSVLASAGCDVVMLMYDGGEEYMRLDTKSELSYELKIPGLTSFPSGYSLNSVKKAIEDELSRGPLYRNRPSVINCTNAWISGELFKDILIPPVSRGGDSSLFYNCFFRINGVEDKASYLNDLYRLFIEAKSVRRKILIINGGIPVPTADEVYSVRRKNYIDAEQMILDLSEQINISAESLLQKILRSAYIDILIEESEKPGMNLNRLTNTAVYLLCWVKRYYPPLFGRWSMPDISCFFYMGGCRTEIEAAFVRLLSRTPTDILILVPDLETKCMLSDKFLFEKTYEETMQVKEFPCDDAKLQIGTAAYHAERDMDKYVYGDTGVYRNYQYKQANAITLKTIYEEIALLWNQELRFRPNFSTVGSCVNMPVLFAKVSGVKDGQINNYWKSISSLENEDTVVVKESPIINSLIDNPVKPYVTDFFRGGRLLVNNIKSHKCYRYSVMREDMQDYLLDKIQFMLSQRLIKGTFETGMEYTIITTLLNLPKDLLRLIQSFDFTKQNPKLIYIHTADTAIAKEDAIMAAFLHLIGFDVVFFVPTGFRVAEDYYNYNLLEEHQIGEYVYDLKVPSYIGAETNKDKMNKPHPSWLEVLFGKGK